MRAHSGSQGERERERERESRKKIKESVVCVCVSVYVASELSFWLCEFMCLAYACLFMLCVCEEEEKKKGQEAWKKGEKALWDDITIHEIHLTIWLVRLFSAFVCLPFHFCHFLTVFQ